MPYSISRKLSQLNRNLTGKLQVTLLLAYFHKRNCTQKNELQCVLIHIRLCHTSLEDVFKTSLRCLDQDEYVNLAHTFWRSLARHLQYVLQKRFQDILKTVKRCLKDAFKTSWRRFTVTSSSCFQKIYKKHCKDVFKTSSRRFQDVSSS